MEVPSVRHYRAFLERIHGFEGALALQASAITGLAPAVAGARARTGRLYRDLLSLGSTDQEVAALPRAPIELRGLTDGFAWLLVIERHVLLAGLIRRYLAKTLGEPFHAARAYLDTHADGGACVRQLGEQLGDAIMRGVVRPDVLVAAMRRAFDVQHYWYARPATTVRPTIKRDRSRDAA
jgi:heme oxygenase